MTLYSACTQVDGNISTWFPCIQEGWFLGSPELMALVLYFFYAILIYKTRMPMGVILSSNLLLAFVLAVATNSVILDAWFVMSIFPVAGIVVFSIVQRFTS